METKPQTQGETDAVPVVKTRWTRRRWIALAAAACLLVAAVPLYFVMSAAFRNGRDVAMTAHFQDVSTLAGAVKARADAPRGDRRANLESINERRDSEVVQNIGTAEAAAARAGQDLADERSKFNADRSRFTGTESTPTYLYEGGRSGQAEAGAKPSEKARYRDHLNRVNKLVKEQKGVAGRSAPRPEPKPAPRAKPGQIPKDLQVTGKESGNALHGRVARAPRGPAASSSDYYNKLADPGLAVGGGKPSGQPEPEYLIRPGPGVDGPGPRFMGREATARETESEGDREGPEDSGRYSMYRASAPGTEQYDRIVENPFLPVAEQPQSTFSIDVDTASYANVRRFLTHGTWPPPNAVRIEEMVNYFKYDYPLPQGEAPFSVDMEVAQCPWNPGHRLLRVGLKGQEIDRKQRGLSNLVFLLDVSGSMASPDKLALVKQAMRLLVEQLDENDRVAIVTYAGTTGVYLESTNGEKREQIIASIEKLSAGGSTNGGAGIKLAYQQAVRYFIKGGTNRVILCTDGDLNVGITRDDDLVELIKDRAKSGVFLTVLGFGTGNLKDSKLEKLADHGNGVYGYIDSLREARKVLVEQLTGSLITIAKDVKLQIEFNPAEVESYRLVGYENRVMAARDFHDDKKDAGEIGAGHTVTALYELVPARANKADEAADAKPAARPAGKLKYQQGPAVRLTEAAGSGELLTLSLRYKQPEAQESKLLEFAAKDSDKRIGEASKDFQFASSVAAFGMILRNSQHRGQATLSAVEEIAASAVGDDPGGYRAEFVDLVRRAKQLRR